MQQLICQFLASLTDVGTTVSSLFYFVLYIIRNMDLFIFIIHTEHVCHKNVPVILYQNQTDKYFTTLNSYKTPCYL